MLSRAFLLLGATFSAAVLAGAQSARVGTIGADDPRFDAARAEIARILKDENLPSVSVAAAKDGKVVWQEAFGWADREKRIAATPHTAYSLASISKPLTATGLMRLVEQKKVDLDKPANDYLGNGKLTGHGGEASGATVRRVLSHTSGLPLHYQFFYAGLPYGEPSMDDTISRYGILVNPPGAVYQYSNLGYGIIDHIIERASGRRYAEFMQSDVFEPLEMSHTSVHIDARIRDQVAERYDANGKPIPYYDFDHDGGSAVYSSAHDLVRFGMFHLGNRVAGQRAILSDDTRRLMQRAATPRSGEQYGLGWALGGDAGRRRVSHTGSMPGVTTILNLYPDENLVNVVLLNTSHPRARTQIAQAVFAAFGSRPAVNLVSRRPATTPPGAGAPPPARPLFSPTAGQVGEWTGTLKTWERELPLTMEVEKDGDVKIRIAGQLQTLLNQVSWRGDRLTGRFAGRIPTADAGRHPHTVQLDVRLRDGKLSGQATALTTDAPIYFALSSYVELARRAGTR